MKLEVLDSQKCASSLAVMGVGTHDESCAPRLHMCRKGSALDTVSCYKRQIQPIWEGMGGASTISRGPITCDAKVAISMVYMLMAIQPLLSYRYGAFFVLRMLSKWDVDMRIVAHSLSYYDNGDEQQPMVALLWAFEQGNMTYSELLSQSLARMIASQKCPNAIETLVVSPGGLSNEAVFGPQLAQGDHQVAVLVRNESQFPSSLVPQLIWPLPRDLDVDLAALFLREVLALLRPRWVFPGDSHAILIIAKATRKTYPPPFVSQLGEIRARYAVPPVPLKGLEEGLDLNEALASLSQRLFGGRAYIRREWGDAACWSLPTSLQTLPQDVMSLVDRVGIEKIDQKLVPRLYLQIPLHWPLVAFRFLARNGTVVAAHLSRQAQDADAMHLEYETIRDEHIESQSIMYILEHQYEGFGALWWVSRFEGSFILHSSARLERHSCIGPVLEDDKLDPCVYHALNLRSPLVMVPSGKRFVDPIIHGQLAITSNSPWNIRRQDSKLMKWIEDRQYPESPILSEDQDGDLCRLRLLMALKKSWSSNNNSNNMFEITLEEDEENHDADADGGDNRGNDDHNSE